MKRQIQRTLSAIYISVAFLVFGLAFSAGISAQCVDHPSGKTALKLSNQTKYDLTFGIDDDDKGVVPSRKESPEWEVEPGPHLMIAGALVDGKPVWVWANNEVPKGQICTWTVEDPQLGVIESKYKYRSLLPPK